MRSFDHDYADELIERLRQIPEGAKPQWGSMTREQLYAHLADVLRYSMGRGGPPEDQSTWFSRHLVKPLFLSGLLRIPKNIKVPGLESMPDGDLETLQAVLEDYLHMVQAGELEPCPHVYFGMLDVDSWARMHVAHFEHHLRQFGV